MDGMKRPEIKTQLDFFVDVAISYLRCLPNDITLQAARNKDMVKRTLDTPDNICSDTIKKLKGIENVENCIDQGLLWLIR